MVHVYVCLNISYQLYKRFEGSLMLGVLVKVSPPVPLVDPAN